MLKLLGRGQLSKEKKKLLIIEDDPGLQRQLKWGFDDYEIAVAGDRVTALAELQRHRPAVATLDLGLPPDPDGATEGLATLEQILIAAPDTKVVMVTGNDDRENAVRSIAMGAYDFFQKPIEPEVLALVIERAFRVHELEMENRSLASKTRQSPLTGLIAASPQMLAVCRTIEKVAPADVTTLLLGESGTGKELLARALHELSPRADQRFVAINCAAIPETLLESELFGYEKGAFTGANKRTLGKIECANGGTLFLDEIGDLPLSLQAKLLRFLQERVIERVGGREEIPVDVRVICATHQDLSAQMKEENFREDLYYRVSEITINIPPVRNRDGDAVLLAKTFLDMNNKKQGRKIRGFTAAALAAIDAYGWPGNVREIENKIKRAVILADGNRISAEELGFDMSSLDSVSFDLRGIRDKAEQQAIQRVLSVVNGNVSKAADMLGVTRPTLYSLMSKYELK